MNIGNLDFGKVRDLARKGMDKARQFAEGLNELEIKVEEATNDDKWGPHGSLMQEITRASFNHEDYTQILGVLARRLHSKPEHWRRIYKSLLLLEYMAKNGPEKIVGELRNNNKVFSRLRSFEHIDEEGKDQGINVRNRAQQIWTMITDPDAIALEREKAAANRNKFGGMDRHGVSSTATSSGGYRPSGGLGGGSGGFGSSSAGYGAASRPSAASSMAPSADVNSPRVADTADRFAGLDVDGAGPPAAAAPPPKKKLSEIQVRFRTCYASAAAQVDSNIAATLAKNFAGASAPPPSAHAAAPVPVAMPAAARNAAPPAALAAPADAVPDLLDFGDEPAAAPPAAAAAGDWADFSAAPAVQPADDPFGLEAPPSAAPAAAASADPFADFTTAAAPVVATAAAAPAAPAAAAAAPSNGGADFGSWATFDAPAAAASSSASRPPLSSDLFGAAPAMPAPAQPFGGAPGMAPFAQGAHGFGAPPGVAPAQGASTGSVPHAAGMAPMRSGMGVPMGGGMAHTPAQKNSDPFADLLN